MENILEAIKTIDREKVTRPPNLAAQFSEAREDWLQQRDRVLHAGGRLVWRAIQNESGQPERELVTEGGDATSNRAFNAAEVRMNAILDAHIDNREQTQPQ